VIQKTCLRTITV